MVVEFKTSEKVTALRKAIDFWYKNLFNKMSFVDFLSCCDWLDENECSILVYDSRKLLESNE